MWLHTGNATKVSDALRVDGGEATSTAGDRAHAGAGLESTRAGLDGARGGTGLAGAAAAVDHTRGGWLALLAGGAAGRGVAGDGAAGALALLRDSQGLELGLGLFGGGIDGEYHALTTVASLCAVEPCCSLSKVWWRCNTDRGSKLTKGLGVQDLHGGLRRRIYSIVLVGLETRVHTVGHAIAGRIERGLSDTVVCGLESENDHVANRCLDLGGLIGKVTSATDDNTVSSSRAGDGTCSSSGDCGGSDGGICCAGSNCLRDCHRLIDRCRRGIVTRVYPNQYDLGRAGNDVYSITTSQN